MAMNDHAYCRAHGIEASDRNLAYVERVRLAGAFLRARAIKRYEDACERVSSRGPRTPHAMLHSDQVRASFDFEARAMANRRLMRDRQTRRAQAQRVRLMHAAPLRVPVPQAAIDGLALFDSARSPAML